ncbi:MAG: response regulator, partial [Gemmatimonadetes bacterium]|nr:response regulator [Gemmatimonadota bacterium]
ILNELILLVDDEPSIIELSRMYLEREGFRIHAVKDGQSALEAVARDHPALIVLDVMLPKLDGFEVCRRLRAADDPAAILMLTARDEDIDKILGLELGADDYLTKPFNPRELVARVKAILRRGERKEPDSAKPVQIGDLTIDPARREVRLSSRILDLRTQEFDLLLTLASACAPEAGEGGSPQTGGGAAADSSRALGAEAISLLGDTLISPILPDTVEAERLAQYREAEEALAASPESADALIWLGRRAAYMGRYGEAIDVYTRALRLHPEDARLYRHRGHRHITIRQLDAAIADLRRAAELTAGKPDEVEPDGMPNAAGIPTSTLQFNVWYHLGLAHYLKGDFAAAAEAYAQCAAVSVHPDSKVATAYWQVMTLKRLGRDAEAERVLVGITPGIEVIESGGYLDLLLLHKGERTVEDLLGSEGADVTLESTTTGYGVGAWHLLQGDTARAVDVFRRVLAGRDQWAAFGYIASEAELARLRR